MAFATFCFLKLITFSSMPVFSRVSHPNAAHGMLKSSELPQLFHKLDISSFWDFSRGIPNGAVLNGPFQVHLSSTFNDLLNGKRELC